MDIAHYDLMSKTEVQTFDITHDELLEFPVGSQILCVQSHGDRIMLYVLVKLSERRTEERLFEVSSNGKFLLSHSHVYSRALFYNSDRFL